MGLFSAGKTSSAGPGDGGSYDEIQRRYYRDDKAKQTAFRDRVLEDPDLHRGVTIARPGGFRSRTRWDLRPDGDNDD